MSRINFIKTLSPSRERELRIWYRMFIAFLVTIVPIILIISMIQLYLLIPLYRTKNSLTQQLAQFNTIIAQQKKDRQEQQLLENKASRIKRYSSDPKNPVTLLSLITNALKESQIISITISKKIVELTIQAPSTDAILETIKQLSDAQIGKRPALRNVTLATLTSSAQQMQATIKAIPAQGLHDGQI